MLSSHPAPWAAIVTMASITAAQPLDADLWVHLNTGRFIARTGTMPYPDPFTFGAGDAIWTAHEWLPALAIHALITSAGVGLTTLAFGALMALTWVVVERTLAAHGVGPWARTAAIVLAALPGIPFGGIRPLHAGVLMTVLIGALLLQHRRSGSRWIWLAPPLFLAWANLHGSFPVGIGLFGALAAELVWRRLGLPGSSEPVRTNPRRLATAGVLSVAALFVNPAGARLLAQPFWQLGQTFRAFNSDWQPPELWSATWWLFVVFLAGTGLAVGLGRRRVAPLLLAAVVALLWAGFGSRKLMVFAAALTPMLLAHPLAGLAGPRIGGATWPTRGAALIAAGTALGIALALAPRTLAGPFVTPMPVRARAMLAQAGPTSVFNTYHWGAYLTWQLWPKSLVFIDGRLDPFAERALPAYLRISSLQPGWQAELAQLDPEAIVLQTGAPLARSLVVDDDWRVAHRDVVATVFLPGRTGA